MNIFRPVFVELQFPDHIVAWNAYLALTDKIKLFSPLVMGSNSTLNSISWIRNSRFYLVSKKAKEMAIDENFNLSSKKDDAVLSEV